MIEAVRKYSRCTLIVGGGIRSSKTALEAKNAGAQIIVTGTMVEEVGNVGEKISEIVSAIKT
jgi:phosphoglycerol geranylgeranyltransferase